MFIQLVALLLALCTHNIKVKGLDDAKYIIAGIYLTTINVLASAMTTYALSEYLSTYTAMFVLMTFFATSLIATCTCLHSKGTSMHVKFPTCTKLQLLIMTNS